MKVGRKIGYAIVQILLVLVFAFTLIGVIANINPVKLDGEPRNNAEFITLSIVAGLSGIAFLVNRQKHRKAIVTHKEHEQIPSSVSTTPQPSSSVAIEPNLPEPIEIRPSQALRSKSQNMYTKKWSNKASETFVALDIETTGLSKYTDHIIEFTALRYVDGEEIVKLTSFVKPPVSIPASATRINGITNDMVAAAPTIKEVMPGLLKFLGDDIVVAHNAKFDLGFIEAAASSIGVTRMWDYIDTVTTAKRAIPALRDYKLGTVASAFHISTGTAHRSEDDARTAAKVFLKCLSMYASGELS